ncbi:PREDICTED: uncharacterized protein LOC107342895 [Acropora digitifera]|uniref:uncharacterized protein LOC107342895 n=1 Tax=Acropora digitifera TaxID=70779 RepID=UPI00077A91AF|nr:PREDICTED: uncharacterized protein LOC107342895 [Acropora digitifera]
MYEYRRLSSRIVNVNLKLLLSFDFQGQVWGVAYKVSKQNVERALGELYKREISLGGYQLLQMSFSCNEKPSHTFVVMVYIATPENPLYLGPATPEQLVTEIASAEGHAGHNAEYVIRLADFMREKVPDFEEEHLFELEKLLRKELGLCTKTNFKWFIVLTELQCLAWFYWSPGFSAGFVVSPLSFQAQVYDVSRYVIAHPGKEAILRNAGGDSTEGFRQQPAHRVVKNHIATLLKTFYIGHVLSEETHAE